MKTILIIACLQFAGGVFAEEMVIFSKGDHLLLGSETSTNEVTDPVKTAFLAAFKADLAHPAAFAGPDKLTDLPEFGRIVPGSGGEIQYHSSFPGGFVVRTTLEGLLPNHKYILTLNGNPQLAGNDRLTERVSKNVNERYYDFLTITTDANGRYQSTLAIRLPAGPYELRYYVKDTADFKIVLYRNFFKFTVE